MSLSPSEENELLTLLDLEQQDKAKETYSDYVEYVHEGRWLPGVHLLFICNKVQQLLDGTLGKQILVLQMPPQHGKSQSITETLPSWYLGKHPTKRVIEASYGDDLAQRFGRRNKDKIERFGKKLFDIEISKKTSAATGFELSNGIGSMISRGIMSGITGQPADLIIIDDPIKNRQEADSQTFRDRLWEEWLNSLKTRLSASGKVILIMTRWHEDDLAGRIIKEEGDKVEVINLPCEAEENDPIGRRPGDALFPEIGKDKAWLEDFKQSYQTTEGKRAWLALFQGRPTAQEGNMLKRQWWNFYTTLPKFDRTLQSWDMTFKDSDGTDKVVGQAWGNRGADIYLIDQVLDRMDFTATIQAFLNFTAKHPKILTKLVEDKANGPAVIAMLRHKVGGIIAVNPEGSKIARASAVSPLIEAGNVYLPSPDIAPWILDFIEECSAFPNGAHDDQVDAMTQALKRFMYVKDDDPLPQLPRDIPEDLRRDLENDPEALKHWLSTH